VIQMRETGESSYRRFLQGDSQALEALIRTYSDALVRFAYGYVKSSAAAEDLAGDAIALLYMKGKNFATENQLKSYLYKVTRSRCVDYLRRHKKEVPLADVENVLILESAEYSYLRRNRNETLYICLQRLPNQYTEILQLTYFSGFSFQECGKILGKTVKQIYNLHTRAKMALKLLLEKEGITDEDL